MSRFITIILLLCAAVNAAAQGHITANTRLAMHRANSTTNRAPLASDRRVRAFITIDSPQAIDRLRAMDVQVQCRFSTMVTATVPLDRIAQVCRVAGVRQVSVAQVAEMCNDSALVDAQVVPVAQGKGFTMPYDGNGVIVGVIDTGVDFNHINFRDAQGNNRVVAAYLPQDSTGVAPIIDGDTLPGSHYVTPEQIALLTTDDPEMSHGTHTTGTAAGSCLNGFQGVATGAQLVICAMPSLYDTDIANSLKYIFDYADRVGKPAVVNMSFASVDGPHDGTSPMCQLFDELSGPGRLISISAHNSGYSNLHLTHNFKQLTDTMSTTIEAYSGYNSTVSFWSSVGHHHQVALTLIDKTDKRVVLEMPYFTDMDPDSVLECTIDSIEIWNQYVKGDFLFATAVEEGDRSHSILVSYVKPLDTQRYRLGLKVVSDCDPKFHAWIGGGTCFRAIISGQNNGTKVGTISDLCTGEKPISVGAHITKQEYPLATGGTYVSPRATPLHDISYFTAWGPDASGKARPDICAPGMVTISSANRYDTCSSIINAVNLSFYHNEQGIDYPYGACYGTSMSAPVMTGTIALWLQAKPDLSPAEIRDILDHTAVRDAYVTAGDARQWGRGKLDAEAGMHYLLRRINPYDINADGVVDISDINIVINVMLGKSTTDEQQTASDVTGDGKVDVSDVNTIINAMLGKLNFP